MFKKFLIVLENLQNYVGNPWKAASKVSNEESESIIKRFKLSSAKCRSQKTIICPWNIKFQDFSIWL